MDLETNFTLLDCEKIGAETCFFGRWRGSKRLGPTAP